jgi:hypothetical protein
VVHLKMIYGVISRCEAIAICRRQADRCWITRGSRNLDIVPFWTLGLIRASVVTKGANISQLCFPTCQIPQKTGCQGGQGSPRAVAPSEENVKQNYGYVISSNPSTQEAIKMQVLNLMQTLYSNNLQKHAKKTPWPLVRKRTILTERPPLVDEILVPTFVDRGVLRGQRGGSPMVVNLSFLDRSRYFSFK